MTNGGDTGGQIRYAMTGLLSAWGEHDQRCSDVLGETRREADALARMLGDVPGAAALATQITGIIDTGSAKAEHELRQAGERYATETRALLALLTGETHLTTAAFTLPDPGTGLAGIIATFPSDDSRGYIERIFHDQPASAVYGAAAADSAATTGREAPGARVDAFTAEFDAELRQTVEAMITHPRSHAIQAHGPDVTDDALKARVTWRKDPMGRDNRVNRWTRHDDGTVATNHGVGSIAGRFNTIEALSKPLQAVIIASGGTVDGLNGFLGHLGPEGRVRLFVPAEVSGIAPGDVAAYRGAGTQTGDMAEHWVAARRYAMENGVDPMPIVPTDPISDGDEPGAAMIFRKTGDRWTMVTCYPVPQAPQDFTRLRGSAS